MCCVGLPMYAHRYSCTPHRREMSSERSRLLDSADWSEGGGGNRRLYTLPRQRAPTVQNEAFDGSESTELLSSLEPTSGVWLVVSMYGALLAGSL